MRKALWVIAVLCAAISVPSAHADSIVQVTISNLTFNGNNTCGASGTALCTQTLSASFQWDNSTNTYVAGSSSFTTVGDLGTNFSLPASLPQFGTSFQGVQWDVVNSTGNTTLGVNLGELTGPFTPPLQPLVTGVYTPNNVFGLFPSAVGTYEGYVSCGPTGTCIPEGFGPAATFNTSGTVTVTAVTAVTAPEPGTFSLMLTGLASLGLVLVMRKRLAQSLQGVTGTDSSLPLPAQH
jgi:hypothetical protein